MPDSTGKINLSKIQSEIEQIIASVRSDDVRSVPHDIPILDLGVSSLALVEGMRQIYDRFGVLVSIRRVIEGQITIGMLALYIEQELSSQRRKEMWKGAAWKVERHVPLAPSQHHAGFLSRYLSRAGAAFNHALALRLTGPLHGPALHSAVEEAGKSHEALRTALNPDQNVLDIGSGAPLELSSTSLSPDQLQEKVQEVVARPFEPGQRLFRADLLRLTETEHVLVLVGHALVLDQTGLHHVLADVARLYRAFSRDQAADMPALALQWTDYLALGNTEEAGAARGLSKRFWTELLAGELPRLELPADHPRPAVKSYAGKRVHVPIDSALRQGLEAFAKSEGVDRETVLLTACTLFVQRLAEATDLIAGVESQRLFLDTETPAIASTRTMLPVRSDYEAERSFREQVRLHARSLREANAHRYLSFTELIRELQLPRDQSRSPLFAIGFWSQVEPEPPAFEHLEAEFLLSPGAGARYDLEFIALERPGGETWLACDYSMDLFEPESVTHWLEGILILLKAGLQDADQPCGHLPLMTDQQHETVINAWNQTERPFSREKTTLDLITGQARTTPGATAVRSGDATLTYGQLLERVDQIASALHDGGARHGDRVGILLKRSLDLIPAILAVWRLGALYVPMDLAFPKKRIANILSDAGARIVITNRDLAELPEGDISIPAVYVEDVGSRVDPSLREIVPANGGDSAQIMYTSGSTGKPKGVEILHHSLVNCLLAVGEALEFTPESRMLALTTVAFDISAAELLMPLIRGGSVDLAEDGLVADGIGIKERLEGTRPSHVQATPSTWKTVLTAGWEGSQGLCLMTAGEALSRDLADELSKRGSRLWNLYGPTETTVYSVACQVETPPAEPIRIGRPLPNTQVYILDDRHQPVPVGAIGGLYIAGDGLAAGYWQKPEMTRERFPANPFRPGERMYWTGDLARYLPNGDIVCLGRLDDQVKIHGVRIEPGEVEAALRGLPGVRDAVVVAWQDRRGDAQLVAHIVPVEPQTLTVSWLRAQLREQLPEVMVPPFIQFTDRFPRTANGKIQRAALPPPDQTRETATGADLEPPATATERTLAKAWGQVLGIDAGIIGRESDFLDLGGHSLLMTDLMIEVRRLFDVGFSLREFFGSSSLRKFAALIDEHARAKAGAPNSQQIAAPGRTPEWARQRMAFLQREAELPRYIVPARGLTYRPSGGIRKVLLTGATGFLGAYLVAEILKTTDSDLYCLVRPKRGEDSRQRIEQQMQRYGVWDGQDDEAWRSAWERRLHIVEGDVTLPRLGMQAPVYDTLAREIDTIFHGAAHVNFIYPYEALRATNVLGIHEIIQFAFHSRIKPVHHLSTAAIWPMGAENTYYEKDPIDHYGLLNLGYDEAKWVGEKCLLHAEERGLPLARYRPGEVGGDSVTGRCVTDHFLLACFKGFLQFGAFPDLDIEVDVAPVDYVARAMVYMAFHRDVLGGAFHLTNPVRRRLSDGLAYLRSLGYRFEELPFVELRDRLVKSPDFARNALFAYQAALEEMDEISMQLPTYDTRETQRALQGSGIVCHPADEKLFQTYLRYLQEIGFIPLPVPSEAAL